MDYIGDLPDDDAIAELYRRATVAVSVPSSDGMPQSVLEAMACGAVPVLSDLPSLREWVSDGREAFFVPIGDSTALSQAIVRLLDDPVLLARLRSAGQERVREQADSRAVDAAQTRRNLPSAYSSPTTTSRTKVLSYRS